ncbi:MAG: RnfABCDGE type electron transport complex subunit B [Gammaproteobacteria bacterium]
MLAATLSLTLLASALGLLLAIAANRLRVESDPLIAEIEVLLPGSQCGQCGYPGCGAGAAALAAGEAPVTLCPPGGRVLAEQLASKLGIELGPADAGENLPMVAAISEDICTGCTRCRKICPTDAILGAPRQLHTVVRDACTGCGRCVEVCPTESLTLRPVAITLDTWCWPRPRLAI